MPDDKDLQIEALNRAIKSLMASVLNQCGDNLCWIGDLSAVRALPEAEFLENCRRYRNQIASERGEFSGGRTIAQLEARVASLEDAIRTVSNCCGDVTDLGAFGLTVDPIRWVAEIKAELDRILLP